MATIDTSARKLQVWLMQTPPLLADLIGRALKDFDDLEIVAADAMDPPHAVPNVILLGPCTPAGMDRVMRRCYPGARIIALEAALSRLRDIETGYERELTLQALLAALRA